jgi:hypothetical protein
LLHLWGIHPKFTAKSIVYNKEIDEKQLDWVIYMGFNEFAGQMKRQPVVFMKLPMKILTHQCIYPVESTLFMFEAMQLNRRSPPKGRQTPRTAENQLGNPSINPSSHQPIALQGL